MENKTLPPIRAQSPATFPNSPLAEPTPLVAGKTVVDFGFVDFGITIDFIECISDNGAPLVVLAYEMEPMCVAKTSIMLEMMRDAAVSPRSVVEVWLSSLWSEATYVAFNAASRRVLAAGGPLEPRVAAVVRYWASLHKVSQKIALDFQLMGSIVATGGDSDFAM